MVLVDLSMLRRGTSVVDDERKRVAGRPPCIPGPRKIVDAVGVEPIEGRVPPCSVAGSRPTFPDDHRVARGQRQHRLEAWDVVADVELVDVPRHREATQWVIRAIRLPL